MSREGRRYRLLIEQLGDEVGRPARGWQSAVARKLSVNPAVVTRHLKADDPGVSKELISRACAVIGVSIGFFEQVREPRSYIDFLPSTCADDELTVMTAITRLSDDGRRRVLAWACDRWPCHGDVAE